MQQISETLSVNRQYHLPVAKKITFTVYITEIFLNPVSGIEILHHKRISNQPIRTTNDKLAGEGDGSVKSSLQALKK